MAGSKEPKFIAWLREQDAPEGVIEDAMAGYMRQQDYTTKTQELSELRTQVAYLAGKSEAGQGSNGASKKSAAEEFLGKLRGSDFGDTVLPLLEGFQQALQADFKRELGESVGAVQRDVQGVRLSSELNAYLEDVMVPQFGEAVREHWPDIRAEASRRLARGEHVVPENLLWSLHPEEAHDLRAGVVAEKRKESEDNHMEGLTRSRRRKPAEGSPRLGPPSGEEGKNEGNAMNSGRPDYGKMAQEILTEMGVSE